MISQVTVPIGGFSHQGYAACPWCGLDLGTEHLVELGKQTYGGTRLWLPKQHAYRGVHMQGHFNGKAESRTKPRAVSVQEQLQQAATYEAWRAADNRKGST
jgi:hypothetical protein